MSENLILEIEKIANRYDIPIQKTKSGQFTEEFIKSFEDKGPKLIWEESFWECVSWHTMNLSEEFIRKYHHKMNWWNLSKFQKLPENLIEEFQNEVDWDNISMYQKLSREFIKKYIHKLNINLLVENKKCNKALKHIKAFI